MFGYATDLRSATQGRATYTMEFVKYAEAPIMLPKRYFKKPDGLTVYIPRGTDSVKGII